LFSFHFIRAAVLIEAVLFQVLEFTQDGLIKAFISLLYETVFDLGVSQMTNKDQI